MVYEEERAILIKGCVRCQMLVYVLEKSWCTQTDVCILVEQHASITSLYVYACM